MISRLASTWHRTTAVLATTAALLLTPAAQDAAHAFSWNFGEYDPLFGPGESIDASRFPQPLDTIVPTGNLPFLPDYLTQSFATGNFTATYLPFAPGAFSGSTPGTIQDLDVSFRIRHPSVSDLAIYLYHTDGIQVRIVPLIEQGSGCFEGDWPDGTVFNQDMSVYLDDQAQASVDFSCDRSIPALNGRMRPTTAVRYALATQGLTEFNGLGINGPWFLWIHDYSDTGAKASILDFQVHINGAMESDTTPRTLTATAPDEQTGNDIVTETDYVANAFHLLGINILDQRGYSQTVDRLDYVQLEDGSVVPRSPEDSFDAVRSSASEFARLDAAPASSFGDGLITVADFVQTNRYAASLDPLVAPSQGALSRDDRMLFTRLLGGSQLIRGVDRPTTVSILMRSKSGETEVGFGLRYDPALLELVDVVPGECLPPQGIFQVNRTVNGDPGLVGVRVGVDPDETFPCDFGPRRPALGTGDPTQAYPESVGRVSYTLDATKPALKQSRMTAEVTSTQFSFPSQAEVTIGFEDNSSPIDSFEFLLTLDESKVRLEGASPVPGFPGATVTFTEQVIDPASLLGSLISTDDTIYLVEGSGFGRTQATGAFAILQLGIIPGEGFETGVYTPNTELPELVFSLNDDQVINPVDNPTDLELKEALLRQTVMPPPLILPRPDELLTFSLSPAGDNNLCPFETFTVNMDVGQNFRTITQYTVRITYDPDVFLLSSAARPGGFDVAAAEVSAAQLPNGDLTAFWAAEDVNSTLMTGPLGAFNFLALQELAEDETITVQLTLLNLTPLDELERVPDTIVQTITVPATTEDCPALPRLVADAPAPKLASSVQEAEQIASAEAMAKAPAPVVPVTPGRGGQVMPKARPVVPPVAFVNSTLGFPRTVGNDVFVEVGASVDFVELPDDPVTNFSLALTYDNTVYEPVFTSLDGAEFTSEPGDDITMSVFVDDSATSSLPNAPSSNFSTILLDGRNAASTFREGQLFDLTFRVRYPAVSPPNFYLGVQPPTNRNVEIARAFFRALPGEGTVATSVRFENNPFFDGLAARNPLGAPQHTAFIDSPLTIVDLAENIPTVRVVDTVVVDDTEALVNLAIESVGEENALGFTLDFNPAEIEILSVRRGPDLPDDAFFFAHPLGNEFSDPESLDYTSISEIDVRPVNDPASEHFGKLKMLVALQVGNDPGDSRTFEQGLQLFATLRVRVRELTPEENAEKGAIATTLRFAPLGDQLEVVDVNAIPLESRFPNGTVNIVGDACVEATNVAPEQTNFSVLGGTGSFEVVGDNSGCPWTATASADWITITSGRSGFGPGEVNFRVEQNSGAARSGTITLIGATHTIRQEGCSFSFEPIPDVPNPMLVLNDGETYPGQGGSGSFTVYTQSPCDWEVDVIPDDATWITLQSPIINDGTAEVRYRVAENVGQARSATIRITGAGRTLNYTVEQIICRYDFVNISQTQFDGGGGEGSFRVETPGLCDWALQADVPWIEFTSDTSGTGSGDVTFRVIPNRMEQTRTGTILFGDNELVITQTGCSYALASNSATINADGGTVSVDVLTTSECFWTAISGVDWIRVNPDQEGTTTTLTSQGPATIDVTVLPIETEEGRSGTFFVEGIPFTIEQSGCFYNFSSATASVGVNGGERSFTLDSGIACPWVAGVSADWVVPQFALAGAGDQEFAYVVLPNDTTEARTATITVNDFTHTITQSPCAYNYSATGATIGVNGGEGVLELEVGIACPWTVSVDSSWVTLTSPTVTQDTPASGVGPQDFTYTVEPNNLSQQREATITVNDFAYTVRQVPCTYALTPESTSVPVEGRSGSFNITAGIACPWTATADQAWVTITSATSGVGDATISFTVSQNPTGDRRVAIITVDESQHRIIQEPCQYDTEPASQEFAAAGGEGTFQLITSAVDFCTWSVTTNVSWITILSDQSGTGPAQVSFRVDPNPTGAARAGQIFAEDATFTITQEACTYTLSRDLIAVNAVGQPAPGDTLTVDVITDSTCPVQAVADVTWIGVQPIGVSFGNTTLTVSVAANDTNQTRTGLVMVGDAQLVVRQFAPNQYTAEFAQTSDGWRFETIPNNIFNNPAGSYDEVNGRLVLQTSDNTNTFGYWRSERVVLTDELEEGDLLIAEAVVSTDVADPTLVPTVRLRFSDSSFNQTNELLINSRGDGNYAPTLAGRTYSHVFDFPPGTSAYRAYFDVMSFTTEDAANALLALESISIQPYSLQSGTGSLIQAFNFSNEGRGFEGRTVPSAFEEPEFEVTQRGLVVRATEGQTQVPPERDIFGFWYLNSDVMIEEGQIYETRYVISARTRAGREVVKELVPPFRARVNTSSLKAASVVQVESRSGESKVPTLAQPAIFNVYTIGTPELAGDDLLFSFDFLLPAGTASTVLLPGETEEIFYEYGVELILERLEVRAYDFTASQ